MLVVVVARPAGASSDLYGNVGPGDRSSGLADRYPLGHYALDQHFSAVKASLTGGVDASGIPSMIAFFLANVIWQITAFCANAVIALFAFAFSLDLLNGSEATGGAGALGAGLRRDPRAVCEHVRAAVDGRSPSALPGAGRCGTPSCSAATQRPPARWP